LSRFDVDALLDDRTVRLILCLGAGGVGKTTLSAGLALRAADRGRRVLVVTIDPAKRLAQALGLATLAHEPAPVPDTGARLDAMMLDTRHAFDSSVTRRLDPDRAARLRANPFYASLAESFSGTQEYVAMERLGELHRRAVETGEWDLIVVDTPPSSSALDFLDGPSRLESLVNSGLMRLLLAASPEGPLALFRSGAGVLARMLDLILGGRLFRDLQAFLEVFESVIRGYESRAGETRAMLGSGPARFVVVAAAEGSPLAEARTLADRLAADGLPLGGVIVNRVQPGAVAPAASEARRLAASASPDQARVLLRHAGHQDQRARELRLIRGLLPASVPRVLVPRRPEVTDLAGLRDLEFLPDEGPWPRG
jgi:anion-transporting  ArsA/GET3 family ATPase